MAQWKQIRVVSLASLSGSGIRHCHELWHRLAAAAPVQPLAWELLYAAGAALKKKKTENLELKKIGTEVRAPIVAHQKQIH